GWAFNPFPQANPWDYVDIHNKPPDAIQKEVVPPTSLNDAAGRVRIEGWFYNASVPDWPLRCEGNLVPPPGGQVTTAFYWAAKVAKAKVKLVAMPKVLAGDSYGDVPHYFEISPYDKVTIVQVKMETKINDTITLSSTTSGNERLKGGDACRGDGDGEANGDTNAYTVFIDKAVYSLSLEATGHNRSNNVKTRLVVKFKDPDENEYEIPSGWVTVGGYLDYGIDVCHLGEVYSEDEGESPDHVALNPDTVVNRRGWRTAEPYTRQLSPTADMWATHPADNCEYWTSHSTQTKNVEFNPTAGQIWRCHNGPGVNPEGTYNIAVRVATSVIPFSDPGEEWMELMASEERCAIFVWYWGRKEVTDLSEETRTVIDIREKSGTPCVAELYPGAEVNLAVEDIGQAEGWDWGDSVDNSMGIAAGIVAVAAASGPVGWAVAAVGYATVVVSSGKEVANILGGIEAAGGGDQGGRSTAFGIITINKSDGDPIWGKFYGDGDVGLGGPNADEFTQTAEGVKTKDASVFYSSGAQALQTWKILHSMTTAAWAEEGYIFNEDAEAWLRWTKSSTDPNGDFCKVQSDKEVGTPDGQWVGE
ncbi:MAG TPA: hypothetical protein VM238_14545, partial [Phycisphaerae bacterium]|nr:hypothetical protein [Phycisphaerae bacterium]